MTYCSDTHQTKQLSVTMTLFHKRTSAPRRNKKHTVRKKNQKRGALHTKTGRGGRTLSDLHFYLGRTTHQNGAHRARSTGRGAPLYRGAATRPPQTEHNSPQKDEKQWHQNPAKNAGGQHPKPPTVHNAKPASKRGAPSPGADGTSTPVGGDTSHNN